MRNKQRGFTLIELLVVVLIIGILAAVALPQYRVAVAKARIGRALPLLSTIKKAQEVSFLQNGSYSIDMEDLEVGITYTSKSFAENGNAIYVTELGKIVLHQNGGVSWASPDGVVIDLLKTGSTCFAYKEKDNRICASYGPDTGRTSTSGQPIYSLSF